MAGRDFAYEPVASDHHVKLRLDLLSAGHLAMCYLTALGLVLVCLIVACFAPAMFQTHKGDIYQCEHLPMYRHEDCFTEEQGQTFTPTWIGALRGVGPMSQFFVISADIHGGPEHNSTASISFELRLTVSLQAEISESESKEIIAAKPLTFEVTCKAGKSLCSTVFLAYEPYVEYNKYNVMISLTNWSRIEKWISDVEIKVRSVDPEFSRYQLWVKTTFFIAALLSGLIYTYQLCRAKVQRFSSETRGLILLSVSLVVFNDPFFSYSLYHPHYWVTTASVLCVVQFICVMGFFWALVLMEVNPQSWHSCAKWLLAVGLVLMACGLATVYVYSAVLMQNDPSYRLSEFPPEIWAFTVISLCLMGAYLVFLGFQTAKALPLLSNRTVRQKFLCYVNFCIAMFAGVCVASGLFQRLPSLGSFVLIVVSTFNLYVILLQALLVPTSIRLFMPSGIELSEGSK